MAQNNISIVIPTLNEEKILPDLFLNIEELRPEPFEIIFYLFQELLLVYLMP